MQDDYEGDFTSRRVLLYTLRFTAKTYLFGPASAATKDIIKKIYSQLSHWNGSYKCHQRKNLLCRTKSNQELYWRCSNYTGSRYYKDKNSIQRC